MKRLRQGTFDAVREVYAVRQKMRKRANIELTT